MTKAKPSPNFVTRLAIITFMCAGGAAWFMYDGYVHYPMLTRAYENFEAYKDAAEAEGRKDFHEQWNRDVADPSSAVYGLPASDAGANPGKYKKPGEISLQQNLGIGLGVVALVVLVYSGQFLTRWYGVEGGALVANGGRKIPFDQITKLDKARWRAKGIALVEYRAGEGDDAATKNFTLDDWKFNREATAQVVREIEANIDRDKVVGGPTELEAEAEAAAAEAEAESPTAEASSVYVDDPEEMQGVTGRPAKNEPQDESKSS